MLLEEIEKAAKIFDSISERGIKIVSHNDADGICAASIAIKALCKRGRNFELRILKQLTEEAIKELNIDGQLLILLDYGSGYLNLLKDILERTTILILDHHFPVEFAHPNLFHLNPMLEGIEDELSASMVTYLFAKALDASNQELVDLAIVGAVGDFPNIKGWGRKIVEEGEKLGKVKVEKGIKLYGRYSRPIHKALEYSFDPFIPGISGSESNAVQFLSELGIEIKGGKEWRKLSDLSFEEQKKLATAILIERLRMGENAAEDIFGENYSLVERLLEIRDAKEFATLINACGRMDRYEIGIEICLNDRKSIEDALAVLEDYRRAIAEYLEKVRAGKGMECREGATYLFAGNQIKDTLIGPILSISLSSNFVDRKKPIFGFVDFNGKVKVSARASSQLKINLKDVIVWAAEEVGGSGGGHKLAAGALIPKGKEYDFVELVEKRLKSYGNKED